MCNHGLHYREVGYSFNFFTPTCCLFSSSICYPVHSFLAPLPPFIEWLSLRTFIHCSLRPSSISCVHPSLLSPSDCPPLSFPSLLPSFLFPKLPHSYPLPSFFVSSLSRGASTFHTFHHYPHSVDKSLTTLLLTNRYPHSSKRAPH